MESGNSTDEPISRSGIDMLTDAENRHMDTPGKERVAQNWETRIDTYTLPCVT